MSDTVNPEKKTWQKPTLTPHRIGALNKFGSVQGSQFQGSFEGVNVAPLMEAYGSPLFVLSENACVRMCASCIGHLKRVTLM